MKQTLCDICGTDITNKKAFGRFEINGLECGVDLYTCGPSQVEICNQCFAKKLIEAASKWLKPEEKPEPSRATLDTFKWVVDLAENELHRPRGLVPEGQLHELIAWAQGHIDQLKK